MNEDCQLKSNANKQEFEDEILDDGIAIVISRGGSAYERTFPLAFE